MKVIESVSEFEEILQSNQSVLIDFYADWCGPCKMITPVLEELSKTYTDVAFVKVNVDNLGELAKRYDVLSIPALFAIKDGKVIRSGVGFQPKPQLEELIKSTL